MTEPFTPCYAQVRNSYAIGREAVALPSHVKPLEAFDEFDRFVKEVRRVAWDQGALWAAVECDAIPNETVQWLAPEDNPYREEQA